MGDGLLSIRKFSLKHLLSVDDQRKAQAQLLSGFSAHEHPIHKNLKILHHRADSGVNVQIQCQRLILRVDGHFGVGSGVIHPVVDIHLDIR